MKIDLPIYTLIHQMLDAYAPGDLLNAITPHVPALEQMVPLPDAPHHAYARKVLLADERGEVLLMRWRRDMFCAPHDHSMARGYVLLLKGSFVERAYDWEGGSLTQRSQQCASSPSWVPFEQGRIHDMCAVDGGLSLHVYQPAITGMRVFDIARRRTLVVADDCGAWVPTRESMIYQEEHWE